MKFQCLFCFSFLFFTTCTGHAACQISTNDSSKCDILRKDVPYGALNDVIWNFGGQTPKNWNFGGQWKVHTFPCHYFYILTLVWTMALGYDCPRLWKATGATGSVRWCDEAVCRQSATVRCQLQQFSICFSTNEDTQ